MAKRSFAYKYIGKRYGRLVILRETNVGEPIRARVDCICDCGTLSNKFLSAVLSGTCKSCGCIAREKVYKHGYCKHPLWRTAQSIKTRCYNTRAAVYSNYGARGIRMQDSWVNDLPKMIKYIDDTLGCKPSKHHTLDRIDNDGNYAEGNLRWADNHTQQVNSRRGINIVFGDCVLTTDDLIKYVRMPKSAVYKYSSEGTLTENIRGYIERGGPRSTAPFRLTGEFGDCVMNLKEVAEYTRSSYSGAQYAYNTKTITEFIRSRI